MEGWQLGNPENSRNICNYAEITVIEVITTAGTKIQHESRSGAAGLSRGGVDELTGGRRVDRDRSRGDYRQVSRAERWRSDTSRRAGQKRRGEGKTTGGEDSGQKLYYQTVLSSCASLRNTVQYMMRQTQQDDSTLSDG